MEDKAPTSMQLIQSALDEAAAALDRVRHDAPLIASIESAGRVLAGAFAAGQFLGEVHRIAHRAAVAAAVGPMTGRFRRDRRALAAQAISDPGHLSCVANDFGYAEVFARYVLAHGRAGDVLLAISTSGTSANVLAAAQAAHSLSMPVIALTGRPASPLGRMADVDLCTPAGRYADRVQELHIKVIHILIELVEHSLGVSDRSE